MTEVLNTLALPGVDSPVAWNELSTDHAHELIRRLWDLLADREPTQPTDGVLQRSLQLEETLRAAVPLQYRYTGLIQDSFNSTALRSTLELPEGKTAFRDANDVLAKTHGIRANEAAARMRLAAAITPVRASDADRDDDIAVGDTRLPVLGAFQGRVNHSKLSSALSMIDEIDKYAETAGKDAAYRQKLRTLVEKDLAEKIEHTTPEEFSRHVGQQKKDLLASIDPPDKNFSQQHTEAMHDVRRLGPVRGNKNAIEYKAVVDAEADEAIQTLIYTVTNPRGKDDDDDEFETRSAGQRRMHALRDMMKFGLANMDKTGFRGASGAHTQMTVITDYATLLDGVRKELADLLPEIDEHKRAKLLALLAEMHSADDEDDDEEYLPVIQDAATETAVLSDVAHETPNGRCSDRPEIINVGGKPLTLPPPKTTNIDDVLDDDNLNRLQQRTSQGIYTSYIPPDVLLRIRCDVGATPVTLTGQRQVLSVGGQQRQFPDAIRRAILARDRGCAVPGCHWAASLCELHHVQYWSQDGETSTDNGLTMCAHHHQAAHAGQLKITRVNGEFRFVLHRLIDPSQQPRKNYFYQS